MVGQDTPSWSFQSSDRYLADGKTKRRQKVSYPTPIAALDDAAHLEGFTWDGEVSHKTIGFSSLISVIVV